MLAMQWPMQWWWQLNHRIYPGQRYLYYYLICIVHVNVTQWQTKNDQVNFILTVWWKVWGWTECFLTFKHFLWINVKQPDGIDHLSVDRKNLISSFDTCIARWKNRNILLFKIIKIHRNGTFVEKRKKKTSRHAIWAGCTHQRDFPVIPPEFIYLFLWKSDNLPVVGTLELAFVISPVR